MILFIALLSASLLLLIFGIILIFKFKKIKELFRKIRLRPQRELKKGFKGLIAKADRQTRKALTNNGTFYLHINPYNLSMVKNELAIQPAAKMISHQSKNYKHFLLDQAYILEINELNELNQSELKKFCRKISRKISAAPMVVYTFDTVAVTNDYATAKEKIQVLPHVIRFLAKCYKHIPALILNSGNIQKHPNNDAFIECVTKYDIPTISKKEKLSEYKTLTDHFEKQYIQFADTQLLKSYPKIFINFSKVVQDIFKGFSINSESMNAINKINIVDNIYLSITNTNKEGSPTLLQSNDLIQTFPRSNTSKITFGIIIAVFGTLGFIFSWNLWQHAKIKDLFKDRLDNNPEAISKAYHSAEFLIQERLYLTWLYPDSLIMKELNRTAADYIKSTFMIPKLKNKSTNNSQKIFLLMALYAPESKALRQLLLNNIGTWAEYTGISASLLKVYILNGQSLNKDDQILGEPKINLDYRGDESNKSYQIVEAFITQNTAININTLEDFVNKIYLPFNKQSLIQAFLVEIYPVIKSKINDQNRQFIIEYSKGINIKNGLKINLKNVQNFISGLHNIQVQDVEDVLKILNTINRRLDTTLVVEDGKDTALGKLWKRAILQATLNSMLNSLVVKQKNALISDDLVRQSTMNIGGFGSYNGKISIIYTIYGIEKMILPEVTKYKEMIDILKENNVKTNAFEQYFKRSLHNYISNYNEAYINMLSNYKVQLNPEDIQSSLLLIASDDSEFQNMLSLLHNNTVFDKEALKDIPELNRIENQYKAVNQFIGDKKNIDAYNQIISELAKQLSSNKNKMAAINKITLNLFSNSDDSAMKQMKTLLDGAGIEDNMQNIFLAPLFEIIKVGLPFLEKTKYAMWQENIVPMLEQVNQSYPFNNKATKVLSPNDLTEIFSPSGKFWTNINNEMYGIFKKEKGVWSLAIPNLFGVKGKNMVALLNQAQSITDSLWDEKGNTKKLTLQVKADKIPSYILENNTYISIAYLNFDKNKIVGISEHQSTQELTFDWAKPITSVIGYVDNRNLLNVTKSFTGNWSFLKLLNAAKKQNQNYCWIDAVTKAKVCFQIKGLYIFEEIKTQAKLEK